MTDQHNVAVRRTQAQATAAIYLTIYAATGDFMRTIAVGSLIAALILIAWETADLLAADLRRITHTEPLEVSQ